MVSRRRNIEVRSSFALGTWNGPVFRQFSGSFLSLTGKSQITVMNAPRVIQAVGIIVLVSLAAACGDRAESLAYDRCRAGASENLNKYGNTPPGRLSSYCDDHWERFWRENDKANVE